MAGIWASITGLLKKRQQLETAIKEISDLPQAVGDLRAIMLLISTVRDEMTKALKDGRLDPAEASRINGRLSDLVLSGSDVLNQIDEAWDAIKPLLSSGK